LNPKFATIMARASIPALLMATILAVPANGNAGSDRLSIFADCHCSDPVGQNFCSDFKTKVQDSTAYRLVEKPDAYGIGVHFWCVDLFDGLPGIDKKLTGTMSAVSVTFTIYADRLPGEVYEDSSVFRVGKDAADQMSDSVVTAVGQLSTANKSVFEHIRETPKAAPAPTPVVIQ
jgi:hypothetical protein